MKALFNCRPTDLYFAPIWTGSAYLQPICNRPLMEYWLELCIWLGIQDILIVLYPGEEYLAQYLPRSEDWGLSLHTTSGDPDDVLPDILSQNADFMDQDLLILDGPIFPFYDKRSLLPQMKQTPEAVIYTLDQKALKLDDTALMFPKIALDHLLQAKDDSERFQRWTSLPMDRHPKLNFPILAPANLQEHLKLNFMVLKAHDRFQLKGFEVAPQIFEGLNNDIAQRPALGGPLLTGSFCKLGPEVQLENVILQHQVRIEGQTHLKNCMVWGPVYLGDLELENSLIFRDQLLDPQTGLLSPLEQPYRLKQLHDDHQRLQAQYNEDAKQATHLLLSRLPLYLILRWFVPAVLEKYYLNSNGETLIVPHYSKPEQPHFFQRLFFAFSLHRVPLLLAVREKRLLLVGTRLLQAQAELLSYMQALPIYAPGAFSHSEEEQPNTLPHWMEELNYCSQVDDEMNTAIWQMALAKDRRDQD